MRSFPLLTVGLAIIGVATVGCASSGRSPADGPSRPSAANPSGPESTSACMADPPEIRWAPDRPTPPRACTRPGAQVKVFLYPPDLHTWAPIESSNRTVVTVALVAVNQEGVMSATLTATSPGQAVV